MVRLDFYQGVNNSPPEYRVDGRTVINEDPVVKSLFNEGFNPDKAEIIVTKNFIKEDCKLPLTSPNIWMNYKNLPVPLKVLKVVDSLPSGFKFLIHDNLYQNIINENLDSELDLNFIMVNNVPENIRFDLGILLQPIIKKEYLEPISFESERLILKLSKGRKKSVDELNRIAKSVINIIENKSLKQGLLTIEIPSAVPDNKQKNILYSRASIFIKSIDDCEEINGLLRKLNLIPVDESNLDLIKFFNGIIKPLSNMIFWFGINLFVSMWQKIKQKTAEIGIIRSGGGTASLLYKLFAFEGFMIALLVSIPGLFFGYGIVKSLNTVLKGLSSNGMGQDLIVFDIAGVGFILFLLLFLCPLASFVASLRPISYSPAVAVR